MVLWGRYVMILGMCGALGALCDDIGYVMWCSGGVM